MDKEIKKGSIDILILSVISKGDTYGYELAKTIKLKSDDLFKLGEGTLYPALKRLENKHYIKSYWNETSEGTRRKYYKITDEGKTILDKKVSEWRQVNNLINLCYN